MLFQVTDYFNNQSISILIQLFYDQYSYSLEK